MSRCTRGGGGHLDSYGFGTEDGVIGKGEMMMAGDDERG